MSRSWSVLVVEDEPLISMMLEDFLEALGHKVVGPAETLADANALVEQGGFDVAILDVRLRNGEKVWPVADKLSAGGIPFVLATGGHVDPPPPQHAEVPVLAKPYTMEAVEPALDAACAARA